MKFSKFQIIGLLLLIWFYTNSGGGLIRPPFIPNLQAEDLESKVLAAMVVLADEHPAPMVVEQPSPIPVKEPAAPPAPKVIEEAKLFPGRYPRAVVLTDTVNCGPCKTYDSGTINVFKKQEWQGHGWTVGASSDNVIEIVDLSKDQEKFYKYFDKLTEINKNISPSTPTTFFLSKDGDVKDIKTGYISQYEFLKSMKADVTDVTSVDNMSYDELVSLHNSLHGGGSWKWSGDLRSHLIYTHGVK